MKKMSKFLAAAVVKSLMVILVASLFIAGMEATSFAVPVQWTTGTGANGHWYEVVISNVDWTTSKVEAENAHPGAISHLATITSAEEQSFVVSLATVNSGVWGFKLGGFQPAGSSEPSGGWQWVTGETWSYTSWGSVEPNNSGNENFLYLDQRYAGGWNDYINSDNFYGPKGYIVEYARTSVPEPATVLLVGGGLVGLGIMRRRFKV